MTKNDVQDAAAIGLVIGGLILAAVGLIGGATLAISHWQLSEIALFLAYPGSSALSMAGFVGGLAAAKTGAWLLER
jgi:hypothetical protein